MVMVYTCRIELEGIKPGIWREFQFHPLVTFHQLHKIIQVVMGWENCHMYEFIINDKAIGLPDPTFAHMEPRIVQNARREPVESHIHEEGMVFSYIYDFGDDWRHTITLTQINASISEASPLCLDGAGCCPMEDVGGVWGHQHMLDVLSTPNHPEKEHFLEWADTEYNAAHFSCDEVNRELQKLGDALVPKSLIKNCEDKTPVKLTKSALNKHLKQLSNDQLIDLVKNCYDNNKEIKKLLAVRLLGEEAVDTIFHEYVKRVEHEFFPERGVGKLRLQDAKKAISEFGRLTGNVKRHLELMLIYVENGVDFTLTYGDIDERFYNSMIGMYVEIVNRINDDETAELFDQFEERIEKIVLHTQGIGWGFHDDLAHMYSHIRWI